MADTHGPSNAPHDDHDDHDDAHAAPEEDAVRTPAWLTAVGLGLLLLGALGSYLWIYPGTMSASQDQGDAGAEAGAADASAEAGAAPVPAAPVPAP